MASVNDMYQGDDQTNVDQPGLPETTRPAAQVTGEIKRPDPKLVALLEDRTVIIAYNNGTFPYIDYVFELAGDDSSATFNLHQMRKIGYQVEAISKCLVLIMNQSAVTRAECRANDDYQDMQDQDVFASNPVANFELSES
jgi:hypothetical protein